MQQAAVAASGAAATMSVGLSVLSNSSPMPIWFMAHQFQLYSLFLLSNTGIPHDIKTYIMGNKLFSFSMNFLPFQDQAKQSSLMSGMNKNQTKDELHDITLNSQSSMINTIGILVSLVFLIATHSVLFILPKAEEENEEVDQKRKVKIFMMKLYKIFTFGVYVRFILEAFQYILLSCYSEIKFLDTEGSLLISIIFAITVFVLLILFSLTSLSQVRNQPDGEDQMNDSKLKEFNTDLKKTKVARIYTPLLLIRRYFFVIWLVTLLGKEPSFIIPWMCFFQLVYVVTIISIRPFENPVNNMLELFNELTYTLLLSFLLNFNKEDKWSQKVSSMFMWIMLINSMVITTILSGIYPLTF